MIFTAHFKDHLLAHPRIAAAFEAYKPWVKEKLLEWSDTEAIANERYKVAISNFMHGAFRCVEPTQVLASWGRLYLRTAHIDDYDFISLAEQDTDCSPWINNWSLGTRIEKFGDNNFFQTIIETNDSHRVGFIDFRDMMHDTQVELKRIAITERGRGYGKEAMYLSQKFAFEVLKRERLYLGTKAENVRAQHVYHQTGFSLVNPENIAYFHVMKAEYEKRTGF